MNEGSNVFDILGDSGMIVSWDEAKGVVVAWDGDATVTAYVVNEAELWGTGFDLDQRLEEEGPLHLQDAIAIGQEWIEAYPNLNE